MDHVRVSGVDAVSDHARKVYALAMSPELRERTERHDDLTREVDSLLESWEMLFDRLHNLSIESARNGRVLAVEKLDLGGVINDVRAARIAIDSAAQHCQWTYSGYARGARPQESCDFNIVGLSTIKQDFNDFLEQLARAEKIMHDHREVLRELAK